MEHVRIDEVDDRIDTASISRAIGDALGATNLALNYYELDPGESFAFGYHMHEDQEEVFLIEDGSVSFETDSGFVELEAGELIRFAPGEYQQGTNTGDERVRAFAIGAPKETGRSELLRECSECEERTNHTIEFDESEPALLTICLECDSVTGRYA